MGGAGLAWPPLHWSFTKPVISFAMSFKIYWFKRWFASYGYCISQIPRFRRGELLKN
jgi:hypothetical protein